MGTGSHWIELCWEGGDKNGWGSYRLQQRNDIKFLRPSFGVPKKANVNVSFSTANHSGEASL